VSILHHRRRRRAEPASSWCSDEGDEEEEEKEREELANASRPRPPLPPAAAAAAAAAEQQQVPTATTTATAATASAPAEADECVICLEPWASEGPHRVCALRRCGHLFGLSCVRAAAAASGRCPLCNEPASAEEDVIPLFVTGDSSRISALDGAAAAAAEKVAVAEQAARKAAEKALASARAEVKRLKGEMRKMAKVNERLVAHLGAAAASSSATVERATAGVAAAATLVDEGGRPLASLPSAPSAVAAAAAPKRPRTEEAPLPLPLPPPPLPTPSSSSAAAPLPFFRASVTIFPQTFRGRCASVNDAAGVAVVGGTAAAPPAATPPAATRGRPRAQLQVVSLLAPRAPSSSVLLPGGSSVSDVALSRDGKMALAAVQGGARDCGDGPAGFSPSLALVSLEASAVALRVPLPGQPSSVAWLTEQVVAAGLTGERVAVFDLRMASTSASASASTFSNSSQEAPRPLVAMLRHPAAWRPEVGQPPALAAAGHMPAHSLAPLDDRGGRFLAASSRGVFVWGEAAATAAGTGKASALASSAALATMTLRQSSGPQEARDPSSLSCFGAAAVSIAARDGDREQERQNLVVASYRHVVEPGAAAPQRRGSEHELLLLLRPRRRPAGAAAESRACAIASDAAAAAAADAFSHVATFVGSQAASGTIISSRSRPALIRGGGGGEGGGGLWLAAADGDGGGGVALWDARRFCCPSSVLDSCPGPDSAPPAPVVVPVSWRTTGHRSPVLNVAAMEPGGGGSGGGFVSLSSRELHVYRCRR